LKAGMQGHPASPASQPLSLERMLVYVFTSCLLR
jgi:hypothetical protein